MRARALRPLLALLATWVLAPATASAAEGPPALSAPAAILVEASTGEVVYQRAADRRRAIASTTKLMTALLTLEQTKLSDKVTAADYVAAPIESKLSLRPGERLSVADLLRGVMLESANDAAVTLAEHVAGSRMAFVRQMNKRARDLKLENTHFSNPIGLDAPANYSSAQDLARLAVALRRHKFIRKVADRTSATLVTGYRVRTIRNRNTLLAKDRFVNGLKTGHTTMAGYVLVGTRTRRGVTLVSVVLGTPSPSARDQDALKLLQWGAGRYERIRPVIEGTVVGTPEIEYRRGATLSLVTQGSVRRTVPAGTEITVHDVGVPETVSGPIRRGQRFGYREVLADGKRIAAVPVVSSASVPAADLPQRTKAWFTNPLVLLLAVAVLGAAVGVGRRLRRGPPRRRTPRQEPEAA
ncbi:MAG TPA: D-alanyl-D-alanine carboxypeptidase family protein [Solirubrobacteraceae bacterium]|nr:D-alanyl-D-alanine carboxypeptidase family protein [Solirubrobacteraceae bacterium]